MDAQAAERVRAADICHRRIFCDALAFEQNDPAQGVIDYAEDEIAQWCPEAVQENVERQGETPEGGQEPHPDEEDVEAEAEFAQAHDGRQVGCEAHQAHA
jgi:hypothetical protein